MLALVISGCVREEVPAPLDEPQTSVPASGPVKLTECPVLDGAGLAREIEARRGSVVVVDFWGSWCPKCRGQFPEILKLTRSLEDRGVKLMTISFEQEADYPLAERFLAEQAFVPTNFRAPFGRSGRSCREYGMPDTILPHYKVYGRDGRELASLGGRDFTHKQLEEVIERGLAAESTARSPGPSD